MTSEVEVAKAGSFHLRGPCQEAGWDGCNR
jgi:hypothetical protein